MMNYNQVSIASLKDFPGNPRYITPEVMEKLKNSIREFGMVDPLIIDERGNIIGGNQRYAAAKELEMKELPCVTVTGLSEEQKKALNIALNKISGEWDSQLLLGMLNTLNADYLEISGFDRDELDDMIKEEKKLVSFLAKEKNLDETIPTSQTCPKCGYRW